MTKRHGNRFRPLFEEDDTTRYAREGWDPRKTYAENMGFEDMIIEDGSLEEPDFEPAPRRRQPTAQVRRLAAQGRGGYTEVAHVARGELVVPRALQTPEFMAALARAAEAYGVPLEMLSVGNARNRINPDTGAPEFFFDALTKGFSDFFARKNAQPATAPGDFMSELPSVRDAAKNIDFSNPRASGNGMTPEMRQVISPWKTIDKDMLTGVLYNEMSSFRGDPRELGDAMWATANVIQNRQIENPKETFGEGQGLASPTISNKEMENIRAGNPDARRAYDMASNVADLMTSAPEAFPSPWPYTQYNHRNTDSKANHAIWDTPSVMQYGPFDSYKGKQWLNIYGPKRR